MIVDYNFYQKWLSRIKNLEDHVFYGKGKGKMVNVLFGVVLTTGFVLIFIEDDGKISQYTSFDLYYMVYRQQSVQ